MRALSGIAALLLARLLCAQSGVTIEGVVVNPLTHTGVAGVSVQLVGREGMQETKTGESGDYLFSGVEAGNYLAVFSKPGYFTPETAPGNPVSTRPTPLKAGADPIRLNREMLPLGALRGRVIGPDGKPAAHVSVEASFMFEPVTAATNDDGTFRFDKLQPGTYRLRAKPPAASKKPAPSGTRQDSVRVETVPTFYPSVTDPAEAQPIEVRGALEQSGLEIHLQSVQVYGVRGTVLDDVGHPVREAHVRLVSATHSSLLNGYLMIPPARFLMIGERAGPPGESEADSTAAAADGRFEFPAVPSGEWRVLAESPAVTDPVTHSEVTPTGHASVLVPRHDVDDVEIRLSGPLSGRGVIDWGDLPVPPGQRISPFLRLIGVDSPEGTVAGPRSDGSLHFLDLNPGRYRIVTLPTLKDGYNVASVWLGDREVTGQQVDLSATSPPIRVVMKSNTGSIRGKVDRGTADDATRPTVLVAPANASDPDILMAVECAGDGSFQIPGMPPGDYSVVAYDRVGTPIGAPVPFGSLLAPATRVRVEEGATASVQLQIHSWPQ
ncbi:MAG TPA: carboxypeptidase regulatory-like domain-containing protein [Bryobacteraceae bacterium]|nr:carboxypeptidase regulatory-like domain-containing protein [Bryobacteraceae bacterium]